MSAPPRCKRGAGPTRQCPYLICCLSSLSVALVALSRAPSRRTPLLRRRCFLPPPLLELRRARFSSEQKLTPAAAHAGLAIGGGGPRRGGARSRGRGRACSTPHAGLACLLHLPGGVASAQQEGRGPRGRREQRENEGGGGRAPLPSTSERGARALRAEGAEGERGRKGAAPRAGVHGELGRRPARASMASRAELSRRPAPWPCAGRA